MASQDSPLSRESQIATVAPGSYWPAVQRTQAPACASSVPPSRKLVNRIHALVRDLLACAVPPKSPAFKRLPFGGGSLETDAAGSPKSMAGE